MLPRGDVDRFLIFSQPLGEAGDAYSGRWLNVRRATSAEPSADWGRYGEIGEIWGDWGILREEWPGGDSARERRLPVVIAARTPRPRALGPAQACTFLLTAGNTTGAETPTAGVFYVRLRDDFHELLDAGQRLRLGSVAVSPRLEGSFGAAEGLAGRVDPQRGTVTELGSRRFWPPVDASPTLRRVGPLAWHPIDPVWIPPADRTSECDGEPTVWADITAAGAPGPLVQRDGSVLASPPGVSRCTGAPSGVCHP